MKKNQNQTKITKNKKQTNKKQKVNKQKQTNKANKHHQETKPLSISIKKKGKKSHWERGGGRKKY